MKDLQPNILNDYEHRVNQLMAKHRQAPAFPQMEAMGVTRASLDDYLFEYQSVLDSEGTLRSQQTLYGIIMVLPVIVLSAFPQRSLPWPAGLPSILAAVAIGAGIAAAVKGVRTLVRRSRLARLRREHAAEAAFVAAVMDFDNHI